METVVTSLVVMGEGGSVTASQLITVIIWTNVRTRKAAKAFMHISSPAFIVEPTTGRLLKPYSYTTPPYNQIHRSNNLNRRKEQHRKNLQELTPSCSVSFQVLPTIFTKSASVTCFPLEKYPAAILASISTRESGGIK